MGVEFNAEEVLRIAEQIEHNGAEFYRKASENLSDERNKKLLVDLSDWEQQHEKTFATMRAELAGAEREAMVFDPQGETAAYLKALADHRVFDVSVDPSKRLTGRESAEEIIRLALGAEKDSIVFYLGMKDMVSARQGKDKIDAIIKEEMSHITILTRELAALRG